MLTVFLIDSKPNGIYHVLDATKKILVATQNVGAAEHLSTYLQKPLAETFMGSNSVLTIFDSDSKSTNRVNLLRRFFDVLDEVESAIQDEEIKAQLSKVTAPEMVLPQAIPINGSGIHTDSQLKELEAIQDEVV